MTSESPIRNISDTAAWVAIYRAMETEREDPVFRDPYARRLAGSRGEEIMSAIKVARRHAWSYTARTHLLDTFVTQEVRAGADMVISEGLIVYLSADEVCELAKDLAAQASFQRWGIDLVSPGLLKMLQRQLGSPLSQAGAPLKFAPEEGPAFFTRCGWSALEVHSMLHTAAKLKRLPFFLRLFALFPDSKGTKPKHIWGGAVLLERS